VVCGGGEICTVAGTDYYVDIVVDRWGEQPEVEGGTWATRS